MTSLGTPSKYAISEFDRVLLAYGAFGGFVVFLYASRSVILSLLLGAPLGMGGTCLFLIAAKMVLPNGVQIPDFFALTRRRQYRILVVILISAVSGCWEAALLHGSFGLLCSLLFFGQLGVLFGYNWFHNYSGTKQTSERLDRLYLQPTKDSN